MRMLSETSRKSAAKKNPDMLDISQKSAELLRKAGSLDDVSKAEGKPLISAVTQHAGLSSRWQDSGV